MTDEQKEANGLIPPKIKLEANGNGKQPLKPSAATSPATVRMVRLKKPSEKSETSRIDLAAAEHPLPETAAKGAMTVRSAFPQAQKTEAPKSSTSRIDLSEAETVTAAEDQMLQDASKNRTARITLETPTSAPNAKDFTTHISLDSLEKAAERKPEQTPQKEGTSRVTLDKLGTSHVTLDKLGTSHVTLDKLGSTEAKEGTTHVTLDKLGSQPIAPSAGPRPIKTVRLQRPSSLPKTVVLSKPPGAAAPPPARAPETAVEEVPEAVPMAASAQETKGATSKIDLPPEAMEPTPPTQRKTIRIKRPDGTPTAAGKTVTISRPSTKPGMAARSEEPQAVVAPPAISLSTRAQAALENLHDMEDDTPGTLFSVITLVALLVAMACAYLLIADFLNLPLPGRIVM